MTTTATIRQPDQSTPVEPLPPARKVSAVVIVLWRFVRRLSAFAWREELARAEAGYQCLSRNSAKLQERYNELLYEVGRKHEGESRHDTARRYIRERENRIEGPACDASPNTTVSRNAGADGASKPLNG